jgi:uncharacterized protein (UPF0335 family)
MIDNNSANLLIRYIERIENLEEDKKNISQDIKAEYEAAKGQGFEPKIMKVIIKMRKRSSDDIREEESLIETYRAALGMI